MINIENDELTKQDRAIGLGKEERRKPLMGGRLPARQATSKRSQAALI
jgi:hypothetical protein